MTFEAVVLSYLLRNRVSLLSTVGIFHCNWLFSLSLPDGRTRLDKHSAALLRLLSDIYGEALGYEYLQSDLHLLLTALPTSTILELTNAFTTQKPKLL